LIQYTLAVDRTNETVAPLYSASDPAVLRLVRYIVRAAEQQGIAVNICGEMSADPLYTQLLIGVGLKQLSVTPHNIPSIKQAIRNIRHADAVKTADRVFRLDTAADISKYLRNRMPQERFTGAER
jgi:phosphotransferase system enzyme I (PtsI)